MLGPGPLIAIDVILLYLLLGPLVLFALYAFFDALSSPDDPFAHPGSGLPDKKDPALWTGEEAARYIIHF